MEISDIALLTMSSVLVLGSSAVIVYINCWCKKKVPEPEVQAVETVIAWK